MPRTILPLALFCTFCIQGACIAQTPDPATATNSIAADDVLKFVVIVSRHGVRSPTGKTDQLNRYSRQPWPAWSVPPGYLTEHGAQLMRLFGTYDRAELASQGLLAPSGCSDADRVRIIADSDQRTRETGNALAAGIAPGCSVPVSALPEGTPDPLFHSLGAGVGNPDKLLAAAAVSGRIGGDPLGLTEAYRPQLEELDEILRGCGAGANCRNVSTTAPQSIFDIPSSLTPSKGNHLVELQTPITIASTMAENMLLEYAEGMDMAKVGWGRVDLHKLREILQVHVAHEDISDRPSYVARVQSSNLLFHILKSIEQASAGHPVAGALSKPGDLVLVLVGHDTNLASISGVLNLSWVVDGRRDDTPPGGALVFELWKNRTSGELSVRTFYTAQTLDQMRNSTTLSVADPPERHGVWVPGCSRVDMSCEWRSFEKTLESGIDTNFVR